MKTPIKVLEPEVVSKIAAGGVRVALPDRYDVIPTKCAKCGSDVLKQEELEMHSTSAWGIYEHGFRFDVYICANCGYSELFFQKASGS